MKKQGYLINKLDSHLEDLTSLQLLISIYLDANMNN